MDDNHRDAPLSSAPRNYVIQAKDIPLLQVQADSLDTLSEHVNSLPNEIKQLFGFAALFFGFFLSELAVLIEDYVQNRTFSSIHVIVSLIALLLTLICAIFSRKKTSMESLTHNIKEIKSDVKRIYKQTGLKEP